MTFAQTKNSMAAYALLLRLSIRRPYAIASPGSGDHALSMRDDAGARRCAASV